MLNKSLVGALALAAVLSAAGIGYATVTSYAYLYGSASTAGVSIAWVESGTGAPTTFTTGSSSNCVASFYSTEVTLDAYELSPPARNSNAVCDLYDTSATGNSLNITNTGGFAVSLSDAVTCSPTCTLGAVGVGESSLPAWVTASGCWAYSDINVLGISGGVLPVTLSPGGVYPGDAAFSGYGIYGWFSDIILNGTASGCAGSSFSVTVTFTGTSS